MGSGDGSVAVLLVVGVVASDDENNTVDADELVVADGGRGNDESVVVSYNGDVA